MNIEQIDASRILISLCDKDMESYSVTFDTLSLSELHSRKVIKELMYRASIRTGISFKNKRIVIEALKYEHGCLLLLTISDKEKKRKVYRIKYYNDSYIFVFDDVESLLACIKALYGISGNKYSSSVYYYKNKYYLVINSASTLKRKYKNMISEFCVKQMRGSAYTAFLLEHAQLLSEKNAVDIIGSKL